MSKPKTAKDNDPCWKERQQTYKCLDENGYDSKKCETHILNGKFCKKFWARVVSHRRQNGITPVLPEASEREKIKADYLKTKPKQST